MDGCLKECLNYFCHLVLDCDLDCDLNCDLAAGEENGEGLAGGGGGDEALGAEFRAFHTF